jgi:hypothetical protein
MDGMGEGPDGMGFDMPMLMNQQPHIFGAYSHDGSRGSPLNTVLPNPTFNDDSGMGAGDDVNDAKRRRIARVSGGRL